MNNLLKKARELVWLEGDPERDHSTSLVVFGTLEIILGVLAFSVAMFLLILVSGTGLAGMKPSHFWMVQGLLFYTTGWFIVMGLGSIKAFRWARVLVLVGSWMTLFFGTLAMALLLYVLPGVYDMLADSDLLSPSAWMAVLYFSIIMLFVLQLVLPMVAIIFYSLQGVQATCERRNPKPSWTDRCPLPLLAMGFVSVLGCLSIFFGATTNYVVFLFGNVWTGWLGFMVVLMIAVICGYVGWGAYMRKMHAWWIAYALVVISCASMMLTFSEMDMDEVYQAMHYTPEQIVQIGQMEIMNPAVLTFITCIWGIMACIYLVWVRDCFIPERDVTDIKSYRQRMAEAEALRPPEDDPKRPRMRLESR